MPDSESATAPEHAEMIAAERNEQTSLNYAEWEVRISTDSHRETLELADKLRQDGIPSLRLWRSLLGGAADEDTAKALTERIRAVAGPGAKVEVEASYQSVEAEVGTN